MDLKQILRNNTSKFAILLLDGIVARFMGLFCVIAFTPLISLAQDSNSLSGYFKDITDNEPIPGVSIQVAEIGQWAVSDANGYFEFSGLDEGDYTLLPRMLGYSSIELKVSTTSPDSVFYLFPLSIELNTVTVTAREATLGSVSKIEGYAIKHTQPVSLSDVLQLVPGQLVRNPTLGKVSQFTIRQAPTSSAAHRMNALGTALIMDGAPISNNANLQMNTAILNSSPGRLPPFASVVGRGLDLRSIPADLIESVEVIRGVPSARHGDLSAGAVLVHTRLGAYKPKMLLRINPTVRQLSFGMGKKIKNNTLNSELDITTALSDPRNDFDQYTRANLQLGWAHRLGVLELEHRLTLSTTLDETRESPRESQLRRKNFTRDRGLRINSKGRWKKDNSFIREMRYIFSLSYKRQKSFFQEEITRDIFPVTDALSDTTRVGEYGESTYLNQTTVGGKPLNIYLRFETGKHMRWLGNHRFLVGAEWRHDSNKGSGRQFNPKNPPRQNYSMGDRPRSYASIPQLNQFGLYFTDRWSWQINNQNLLIDWGFRADIMHRLAQSKEKNNADNSALFFIPAPRINASLTLGRGWQARAGFGIMAKMPTLSYLYPNPVFFDLINFNYYATNPAERLVVLTTRKIVPNTSALRPYQSKKWELGIDHRPRNDGWNFSLSLFHEQVDNAYQIRRQIRPIRNQKFKAIDFPKDKPPVLSTTPIAVDTFMAAYDLPQNNLAIVNKGIDFTLQTPQIEAIRTSFNLTGAFIHTRSKQTTPFLDANRAVFSNQFSGKIPIFPAGQGSETMRFNTGLRLIHHIPALKFIVSGLVQTIWTDQNRLFGYSNRPEAYLSRNGKRTTISEGTLSDKLLKELGRTVDPKNLQWQHRPPLWLFNIRITKEWAPKRGFAFYVNNLVNSKPLYTSNISGFRKARNQPEFTFGAEIYYQF